MAMERELLRHVPKKPITLVYPFKKRVIPEGSRGKHVWFAEKCIGCGLCEKDCPAFAIEMIGRGLTAELKVYLDRCVYCGQCEEICPTDAIKLTKEYEFSDYGRDKLVLEFKRPASQKGA